MPETSASTRLGLISDTHGDAAIAAAAVRMFNDAQATALIHLGDVNTDAVLEELVAFVGGEVHLVFGNCDDAAPLGRHAERLGLRVHHPAGLLEFDGRRVGFTHGHLVDVHDDRVVDRFLLRLDAPPEDGRVDYLLHGHTHVCRDERRDRPAGSTRIVNPGALHRAERFTVALLVPAQDRLETFEIDRATMTAATAPASVKATRS